jgi:hypothetical protein
MSNDNQPHATAGPADPADPVAIETVMQETLDKLREALQRGNAEDAHCLADTYETLVRAETQQHVAVRAYAERALRQLHEVRRAPSIPAGGCG